MKKHYKSYLSFEQLYIVFHTTKLTTRLSAKAQDKLSREVVVPYKDNILILDG